MGAKSSVAVIQVTLEGGPNTLHYPGDTVRGTVYLSVHQDEVTCTAIGCRVLGQEKARTHRGVGRQRRTYREIRNFLDLPYCFQEFPERIIRKGQYEYPFSFTIPPGSPASMEASQGSDKCAVEYSVETWLDRPRMLRWDIRSVIQITVVNSVPPHSKTPLYMEPHSQDVYSMFCINRGKIVLGGSAESSSLHAGECTSVKYAADNISAVTIKAIEISLDQEVTFAARGHKKHKNTTLCYSRIDASHARLDLATAHSRKSNTEETLRSLSKLLESNETKNSLTIPAYALSSYNGSLVQVTHSLKICICTTFGTANPSVSRNVAIYSQAAPERPFEENSEHQISHDLPSNWVPAVAEAVVLPPLVLTATVVHDEENEKSAMIYPSAPLLSNTSGYTSFSSFSELLKILPASFDPCGEVSRYISQGNSVNALQPKDYFDLFSAISSAWDQQRVADILADHLTSITCEKVARAAAASQTICQREVVESLLKVQPLVDRENSNLVMQELTPFQRMTVEKYFR